MLLKPPRPQTKWFWKTNSQLDPFLAFKTSNTKNNPIVVDEILACPSSNFDFFSRFGNWATSTSTCTNFYDRFSGWPLKQKGMDLYIIAMYCCHSWCWWVFSRTQNDPHAQNPKTSWHFCGSKFRCAIHSADRWWSWLHFDDLRMNPKPRKIFQISTWWPSGSTNIEFSRHCQRTNSLFCNESWWPAVSNSWWLLQRNMIFYSMLTGLLIHSIPKLNTLGNVYVPVSVLVPVCLLHCSYELFPFCQEMVERSWWQVGEIVFFCQVQTSKSFKSWVLVPRPKTVRIVSLRKW